MIPKQSHAAESFAFALAHADQWRGCVACCDHHHETNFCQECGRCYLSQLDKVSRPGAGTSADFDVIKCACGAVNIWD